MNLKSDHGVRPCFITQECSILVEVFSPLFSIAQEFLVSVAEPVSRLRFMHEYAITTYSLYAALSLGITTKDIITILSNLCKTDIPGSVIDFINENTQYFGKVKLILKNQDYFVQADSDELLQILLKDDEINAARKIGANVEKSVVKTVRYAAQSVLDAIEQQKLDPVGYSIEPDATANDGNADPFLYDDAWLEEAKSETSDIDDAALMDMMDKIEGELEPQESQDVLLEMEDNEDFLHSVQTFEIKKDHVEQVRKRCRKPQTKLRPYQQECLAKMFSDGLARSGIIVLPCGSGKTLVGVTATATIKKRCLVLCTSSVSVEQWAREFKTWSTINPDKIAKFTSNNKLQFHPDTEIVISTYTMLSFQGKRAYDAQHKIEFIKSKEWGFLLLDEVHVVPADMFKKVLTIVPAHCKLGLTATLVREDEKIESLNYLIGPKLYEANWSELANSGFIAKVECAEVWCRMTNEFYREYLRETPRKRQLLYTMNPAKLQACQYLIKYHQDRGDKIIVFSDNVFALKHYATRLHHPFIYGGTSQQERMRILGQFKHNPALHCLFLSKVGDTSIDLPEASVLIQISSHYGSRRQEAQRLGRILRAKGGALGVSNAHFYTLVSRDTVEMYYSTKRQQFLVDQGYQFKVITELQGMEKMSDLVYPTLSSQLELLNTVLMNLVTLSDDEEEASDEDAIETDVVIRRAGNLGSLSGADTMAYMEVATTSLVNRRRRRGQT